MCHSPKKPELVPNANACHSLPPKSKESESKLAEFGGLVQNVQSTSKPEEILFEYPDPLPDTPGIRFVPVSVHNQKGRKKNVTFHSQVELWSLGCEGLLS